MSECTVTPFACYGLETRGDLRAGVITEGFGYESIKMNLVLYLLLPSKVWRDQLTPMNVTRAKDCQC